MSKTQQYEDELLKAIKDQKLMRFDHAFGGFVSFARSTAYEHNLDKSDVIKEALIQNRSKGVNYLLQKWVASDNPTLQIAAMRLVCDTDEHRRLNQNYIDHTTQGEKIQQTITVMYQADADELQKI